VKFPRRILLAATGTLVLIGVLFGAPRLIEVTSEALSAKYPAPGQLIPVKGRTMHLYCTGAGSPAVILESGLGTDWSSWRIVMPEIARFTRVCAYDRAGYGWSEPGPAHRTAARLADELHSLLRGAGIPDPYLLVAHSFGAYVSRVYVSRFPESVSGLILVDPSHEDEPKLHSLGRTVRSVMPPSGLGGLLRLCKGDAALPPELKNLPAAWRDRFLIGASYHEAMAQREESEALPETESEVRSARFPRDLPLTVITAAYVISTSRPRHPEMADTPVHQELQAKLTRMSSHGKQIVAGDSGHMVQLDRPDLIVRSVLEMEPPSCRPRI
jgi:pimeloyl-ACP methyl ester carboxylesterase